MLLDVEPAKAHTPELRRSMTAVESMRAVIVEGLRHLLGNVPGIFAVDDREFVHQARVAVRRLRTAQKIFSRLYVNDPWTAATADLQWLGSVLGELRDWQVFLHETLPSIAAALPGHDFTPLRTAAAGHCARSRARVHVALRSRRYRSLQRHLQQLADDEAAGATEAKLPKFARKVLRARWRKVDELGERWPTLDGEQRHDLRKRIKKLRYAVEFFSPLFKPKAARAYLKRLRRLQEILGRLSDLAMTQTLLRQLVGADQGMAYSAGLIVGWLSRATDGLGDAGFDTGACAPDVLLESL